MVIEDEEFGFSCIWGPWAGEVNGKWTEVGFHVEVVDHWNVTWETISWPLSSSCNNVSVTPRTSILQRLARILRLPILFMRKFRGTWQYPIEFLRVEFWGWGWDKPLPASHFRCWGDRNESTFRGRGCGPGDETSPTNHG